MSYPRNNASPPGIDFPKLFVVANGAAVTCAASVTVKINNAAETAGLGALRYLSTSGGWTYIPTQAETNCNKLGVHVYKASCTDAVATVYPTHDGYRIRKLFAVDAGTTIANTNTVKFKNPSNSTLEATIVYNTTDGGRDTVTLS